jgi:large repetitive protein
MSRSWRVLIPLAALALGLPLIAQADPSDTYTANAGPAAVQPLTTKSYTITITNSAGSHDRARDASVGIPPGFAVDPASLVATTTASGSCASVSWTATLAPEGSRIDLSSSSGAANELCPGGVLTVTFQATASAVEGTYAWKTQLVRGDTSFALNGPEPAVTVDGSPPPQPTIESHPPAASGSPDGTLGFSDSEGGVGFQCSLDADAFAACTSPKGYSGLSDGSHTFRVKAIDEAGNESTVSAFSWTIDTAAPPAPSIGSHPPAQSASGSASFGFTDSEAEVGFQCRVDAGPFADCTSPTSYSGLADGSHAFEVKARDAAGNESPVTSFVWTIDTIAPPVPEINADSAPPNVTASTTATFAFSDADSTATFRCSRDGSAFAACTSPKTYSGLGDGSHSFEVKARDQAGNDSAAASWTWVIDTVNPVVAVASGPEHLTNQTSAIFTFSSNKSNSTYKCKLDGSAFGDCTSPATYTNLTDGLHSFQVRATDGLGTTGPATVFDWTVDTVAPPAPAIAGGPPAATSATSATFVFSDSEPGLSFECQRDAGAFVACTSPATYTALPNGPHTFAVRAIDAAGNTGAAATRAWTVDTLPPDTAVSSGPGAVSGSSSATFTFASSEGGSSFACSIDGGAFAPCVSPQSYGGFGGGPHSFRVRATDAAGNADPTPASYAWTVDLLGASRTDRTPPGNVANVGRGVGYRTLRLTWKNPTDSDFARVQVLVTNDARGAPGVVVYSGTGTRYSDSKFRNGVYYRYAIISYDRAGNASKGMTAVVAPNALLGTPKDGAKVKAAPLLDWATVRSATFYNVQLYRGSTKVLSAWPRSSKLTLKKRWSYRGRRYTLKKGRYRWFVWPGFGRLARGRYGQLIGQSSFVVR